MAFTARVTEGWAQGSDLQSNTQSRPAAALLAAMIYAGLQLL